MRQEKLTLLQFCLPCSTVAHVQCTWHLVHWSSFVLFQERELKNQTSVGKNLFWTMAPYAVSFPSSDELPGSSSDRMDVDRKPMRGPVVRTHHSCFTVSGPGDSFRKKRSFVRAPLLFLSPGYEAMRNIKEVLKLFCLFPSFDTYVGHKESMNSTLWMKKPSILCEPQSCEGLTACCSADVRSWEVA